MPSLDLTLDSLLGPQADQNHYSANFKFDHEIEPSEYQFFYRTNMCGNNNPTGRVPHLQMTGVKQGRVGNTFTYSFDFILLDYPLEAAEQLSLGCTFKFPDTKKRS